MLTLAIPTIDRRKGSLKRMLDVSVSLTALAVLLPLLLLVWGLIRFTSRGPAFFVQQRVGHNQRLFKFYKFRTMVQEAPVLQQELESQNEMDGAIFKIRKDPRVTSLGRMLRKSSIDELPQLVNVILGDMSLVGPRPLPVQDVARLDTGLYGCRFGVKPGITGLWQISGRNAISFDRMMELDIFYAKTWTITGDIKILLRTVPVVLSMRGAY